MAKNIIKGANGLEWTEVDFSHLRRSYATYIPVGDDYGWVITIAHVPIYDELTDAVSIKVYPAERADDGNIVCAFDYVKRLLYYIEKLSYPDLSDYIDLIDLGVGTLYYDVLDDDGDYSYRESLSITRKDSLQLEVLCCNESTANVDEQYHAHFVCSKVWNEDIENYVLVPFNLMQSPRDADDMRLLTDNTFKSVKPLLNKEE